MTKSKRKNVAEPRLELATPWFAVRLAPDCARQPGKNNKGILKQLIAVIWAGHHAFSWWNKHLLVSLYIFFILCLLTVRQLYLTYAKSLSCISSSFYAIRMRSCFKPNTLFHWQIFIYIVTIKSLARQLLDLEWHKAVAFWLYFSPVGVRASWILRQLGLC